MPRPFKKPAPCKVEGCDRLEHYGHLGFCHMHYQRFRRHGDPTVTLIAQPHGKCTVAGCTDPVHGRGYCNKHYKQFQARQ